MVTAHHAASGELAKAQRENALLAFVFSCYNDNYIAEAAKRLSRQPLGVYLERFDLCQLFNLVYQKPHEELL
jgi:hypothetical protein